ncbi:hypothetical protein [Citricoccus sp. K5]|uniref:hypothetical protein n=1 Tax=Citricoccus sp. K5 TaxID=2653135 RepID=UPI0012F234FC|nr:hypothetical protein [Citricoccus sp. K5]VXB24831.1 conserved hypothetical protein [Citricoccus sp. K5]
MSAESWFAVADMSAQYRISDKTVRAKVASGEWPADRIGRLIRFSPEQQDIIRHQVAVGTSRRRRSDRIREALERRAA